MTTFTRRTLVRGGTALTATAALAGPALLEWASAWAQAAPWKPEAGAKLTVMRWKRFVEAEDQAFMAMVDAFKKTTGVDMNVFSESFEDLQPKASVSANTGQGPDLVWGLHSLPQLFPDKVIEMTDVADYLRICRLRTSIYCNPIAGLIQRYLPSLDSRRLHYCCEAQATRADAHFRKPESFHDALIYHCTGQNHIRAFFWQAYDTPAPGQRHSPKPLNLTVHLLKT